MTFSQAYYSRSQIAAQFERDIASVLSFELPTKKQHAEGAIPVSVKISAVSAFDWTVMTVIATGFQSWAGFSAQYQATLQVCKQECPGTRKDLDPDLPIATQN